MRYRQDLHHRAKGQDTMRKEEAGGSSDRRPGKHSAHITHNDLYPRSGRERGSRVKPYVQHV
jgi:hypothetical protein